MRRTDQLLIEQMQISDVEIVRRMELLSLKTDELNLLLAYKKIIEQCIDEIVDEFYEKQTAIDEIALLIGDADTLMRLRSAQRRYILDLFSGNYDSMYVNNRLRIGLVHKRIGVEPKLYLSAVKTLKDILFKTLLKCVSDKESVQEALDVLEKLFYFDITLVFDTYIDSLVEEIETAKRRTEIYAKGLEVKVAERTRQLEEQANIDPLTNVYNQRAMHEIFRRELAAAKRHMTKLSFVYFDVDKFKEINDTHGHIKGDEVLKAIGLSLKNNIRETDVPCRYGGDEFCIILPDCDIKMAESICKNIIAEFKTMFLEYTFSMGIVETGPENYFDIDQLIKLADAKMYEAKAKNGYYICT